MRRRARCHSRLVPAIPPPITSTSACSGNGPGYFSGGGAQNGVLMAPSRIRLQVDFESYDVLVVGGGLAGIRAAIAAVEANPRIRVGMVSKVYPMRSHTVSAEGGAAAVMRPEDSYETHAFDTIKGSDYLADQDVVEAFVREAPIEIIQMEHWGCPWSRDEDGKISVRPFGGMTTWRTCFAADKSGFHMLHAVFQTSLKYPQIIRHDEAFVTKLLVEDSRCVGVVALDMKTGRFDAITARSVILATGGLGRVYALTTNGNICTGDGMALAYRAGVGLKDMEMVQFHPTGLPFTGILITEAVRGEGGYLYNNQGERFLKRYVPNKMELGPRDIISRAMTTEFEEGRGFEGPHGLFMHLDVRHLGEDLIDSKLPFMRELGREFVGIDIVKDPIPVRPVQHSMDQGAGVYRTREGLAELTKRLDGFRERFEKIRIDDSSRTFNTELMAALELDFMLECAVTVAHSALAREESRGAHARRDFPERDDKRFLKHTMAFHTDGAPRLEYSEVHLGKFEPKARSY